MKAVDARRFVVSFLLATLAAVNPACAQLSRARISTEKESIIPFQPLEQWEAAVLAGNESSIAAFYIVPPPGTRVTTGDPTRDPSLEPVFWGSLKSSGLSKFDAKVLEVKNLQPGAVGLVLRFELKIRTGTIEKSQVISGSQVWVEHNGAWKILSTQRGDLAAAVPRRLPEPAIPNTKLYPKPEQALADLTSTLALSAKDHKRIVLVFGGNWCYDCHVLDTAFHSKDLEPLITQNYHIVHINVAEFNKNTDIAERYEVPLEKGVPSLAILDSDGHLLVSQKQGEFESTTRIGPEDVAQFLQRWKPQH